MYDRRRFSLRPQQQLIDLNLWQAEFGVADAPFDMSNDFARERDFATARKDFRIEETTCLACDEATIA